MRKLSCKCPVWLTLICFAQPIFYVLFRIGKPEIFSFMDLARKVGGAIGVSVIVWVVYGIACLFARTWVNCGNCKFSKVIQGSEVIECQLTSNEYHRTYSCRKSEPKEGQNNEQVIVNKARRLTSEEETK